MACSIFLCNAAGKSKFGSGTGKRDAKGIYRKYKLIKAYIFFAKGMTQKNAIEKFVRYMENENTDLVVCSFSMFDGEKVFRMRARFPDIIGSFIYENCIFISYSRIVLDRTKKQ